ncbi:hypothetical protein JCM17846_30000 [Iodidimonas nitroreducens]|uniref:TonB-dependent receptor plug domain-containing protein n=1 Tax=Iodidimonas nitroreducens TaxID=1236968 RepID=A0A5A7NB34_9PROT|nr:TonB-dependent receptor plug domain-containing protein [Iodidimonas nitroreducens]GER05318.1 hypothetical protein JCM17846_30000 [Iodidimonas nitroreducens]
MHPQDLKKSRRLRLLAASSIGILAMTSSAVWSQESTDEEDEEALEVEEIVVTGSRISRAPGMEASPVLSIDGDAVKLSGFNNLADFLSDIPALQGSQVPDDTTGAVLGTSGLSLLNLRQLGEQRTLTLIDGRRQVGSDPGTAAVNIDTLNFLMVERTEVLTGGASSIYGADAVSGVVNFVLRKNFEGLELDGQFAIDENGEGQSARFSGIMGGNFANNKGNAMLAFEYRQNEEILQTDLDFFNRNRALVTVDQDAVTVDTDGDGVPDFAPSDGVPNFFLTENAVLNIITNGGLVNTFTNAGQFEFGANGQAIPFNPGTQLPFSDDPESAGLPRTTQIGGTGVLVNELQASLTPDSETYNIQAKSNFEIADGFRTFVDMKYTYIDSQFTFQPSFFSGAPNGIATANADRTLPTAAETFNIGAFTGTDNAFLDPVVGQAIDNGFGIGNIQRFMSEFNRGQNATRQTFRFVGGFEGEYKLPIIEKEWNWDVAVNFSRDDATNRQQNSRLNPNFFASIDAIQINEDDIAAIEAAGNTPTFDVGDIVCRVQFLEQAGLPTTINGVGAVSQNTIDNCVAGNIFGVNSLSQEAIDFASVDLNDKSKTEQLIVSANWSGDLFNLTGAGDIGVAWAINIAVKIPKHGLMPFHWLWIASPMLSTQPLGALMCMKVMPK